MIHRIEVAPDFVIHTGDEGARLFEEAVGEQLRELMNNKEKVFNDGMEHIAKVNYKEKLTLGMVERAMIEADKKYNDRLINKRLSKRRK